jgi:hypothetical protein
MSPVHETERLRAMFGVSGKDDLRVSGAVLSSVAG